MKTINNLILLLTFCFLNSCQNSVNKIESVKILYENIYTSYFAASCPSTFMKRNYLETKVVTDENTLAELSNYITKLQKAEQYPDSTDCVETRIGLIIKNTDGSTNFIFLDASGDFMLDTIGLNYKANPEFKKFISRTINNPMVDW